ncbi:MAG: LamG-like jellyroll fold domain-containing protein, partial [Phycisphaerales bacterium]
MHAWIKHRNLLTAAAFVGAAVASHAWGQYGNALSLGWGDSMQAQGTNFDSSAFTCEAWVNVNNFGSNRGHLAEYSGTFQSAWNIDFVDYGISGVAVQVVVDGTELASQGPVFQKDSWHHVAITFDGTYIRLYVDSTLVAQRFRPGSLPAIVGGGRRFDVGGGMAFSCDEMKVWRIARTADQIRCTMNTLTDANLTNLLVYYRFADANGCVHDDSSTRGYDAQGCGVLVPSGAPYTGEAIAPRIVSQPAAASVCIGSAATMTMQAAGYQSITYRWHSTTRGPLQDGVTAWGSVISGAATGTLQISNCALGDAGNYFCVASGPCTNGNPRVATSATVALGVSGLIAPLQGWTTGIDRNFMLEAEVSGSVSNIQWRHNGIPMVETPGRYEGTNTRWLWVRGTRAQDAGLYDFVYESPCGAAVSPTTTVQMYCETELNIVSAGTNDLFVLPPDDPAPAEPLPTPRVSLRDWASSFSGGSDLLEFDERNFGDRVFAHSFTGVDSTILSGRLKVRVRPATSGTPANDRFGVGFATGSGANASFANSVFRFFGSGNTESGYYPFSWIRGTNVDDQGRLLGGDLETQLPLVAWPLGNGSRRNLCREIQSRGFLDLIVEDDSVVDWAQLEYYTPVPGSGLVAFFTQQPASTTVCLGQSACFAVASAGSG